MRTVIVRLRGGLGNQMFQYAAGRQFAFEKKLRLYLDASYFNEQVRLAPNDTPRYYYLDKLNISAPKLPDYIGRTANYLAQQKRFRRILNVFPFLNWRIFSEKHPVFIGSNVIMLGYWQCEEYFALIRSEIENEFSPREGLSPYDSNLFKKMRDNPLSVAVHIRRGDYVNNFFAISHYYTCTSAYYREAMTFIANRLSKPPVFYFFSDDPNAVDENITRDLPGKFHIVSNGIRHPVHELHLMSGCNHQIISNSSFSWWAAWLNQNPKKMVVRPHRWFNNNPAPHITPRTWIKLQHNDEGDWREIEIPYAKERYRRTFGRELDLSHPTGFNEKIQWLKIFNRDPQLTRLVDKYHVREYVERKIGTEFLNDLYGVYPSYNRINFPLLPRKFVLKASHGSGWNVFCTDKESFDYDSAEKQLSHWLSQNYYYIGFEFAYKNIQPRIIAEKYLGNNLNDYKIFCFHGDPLLIQVDVDRFSDHKRCFYDADWVKQPFTVLYKTLENDIPKPRQLGEMLSLAGALSAGLPFARVDFYIVDNRIYFGEITLYPENGFGIFLPDDYDLRIGSLLDLSEINNRTKLKTIKFN